MEVVFGYENKKIFFVVNDIKLERNDNKKIKDYFSCSKGNLTLPIINVFEMNKILFIFIFFLDFHHLNIYII